MLPPYGMQMLERYQSDFFALCIFFIGYFFMTIVQKVQKQRRASVSTHAKGTVDQPDVKSAPASHVEPWDLKIQRLKALCADRCFDEAARVLKSSSGNESKPFHYNTVLEGLMSNRNLDKAEEILNEAIASNAVDIVSFNMVIKLSLDVGEVSRARKIEALMLERGFAPNLVTYNEFIDASVRKGNISATWRILDEMVTDGVQPNHVTASIVMKTMQAGAKPSHIERAMSIVNEIDEGADEVLLGSVVEACIRIGQRDFLLQYLKKFRLNCHVKIAGSHSFGSIIRAFGFVRDLDSVWQVWNEMRARGIPLTSITLGNMVEALVVNGETDAAFKVITDSKRTAESRSAINAVAYGSVMKGHSLARNIKAVWAVYQDMLAEGTELSAVTYNILVNACCRCEEMDRIPAILEKMAQENLKPDIVTFSAIIKGYCLIGQIDHAFELLKSIDRDGHTPDEFTYNTLIDGCARQGQYERGMRVLKTMQDAGVPPSNFTLSVLVKLVSRGKRLQEAFELCETISQTHRFGLNVHVYNNLVQACIHNGDVQRGISVLAKMARESTLPDQRTYRLLLNATAKRAAETKAIIALLRAAAGLPPGLDALEHVDATKLRPTGGLPPELVSESLEAVAMVTSDGGGALAMNLLADLRSIPSMRVDSKVAARITSLALRDGTQSGALKTKP